MDTWSGKGPPQLGWSRWTCLQEMAAHEGAGPESQLEVLPQGRAPGHMQAESAGLGFRLPKQAWLSFPHTRDTHSTLGSWPHSRRASSARQEKLGLEGRKVRGKSLNWMSAKSV